MIHLFYHPEARLAKEAAMLHQRPCQDIWHPSALPHCVVKHPYRSCCKRRPSLRLWDKDSVQKGEQSECCTETSSVSECRESASGAFKNISFKCGDFLQLQITPSATKKKTAQFALTDCQYQNSQSDEVPQVPSLTWIFTAARCRFAGVVWRGDFRRFLQRVATKWCSTHLIFWDICWSSLEITADLHQIYIKWLRLFDSSFGFSS